MKTITTAIFILIWWGAIITGCTTAKYVPLPSTHQENEIAHHTTDTYERDTVYLERLQSTINDTVYISTTKYKERVVERKIQDTLIVERTDSIPYPVEVQVFVERKIKIVPWYVHLAMWLGVISTGYIVLKNKRIILISALKLFV